VVIANNWVTANDLDDLGGAEGGPQPAEGRELVKAAMAGCMNVRQRAA
jgi:uncharacterized OsmC-like protein